MNKLPLSILGLASVLLFSACSGASKEDSVSLTFLSTFEGKEAEFIKSRIAAFEQEHPNIKVTTLDVSFGAASNSFKTALLGDQPLDLMRADNSWVPEFADLNLLYPLDSFLTEEDKADFNPTALRSVQYKEHLYGLPSVMEAPALLYNKRILQEAGFSAPPESMDELYSMAKAMTAGGRYGIFVSDDSYFALPYLWAFGGETITDDRKVGIASGDSVQGLAFMQKLKADKVAQPNPDFKEAYNTMMGDFKEGRSAMILNGPWAVADLLTGAEFKDAGNLGITAIPKGPKGQGSPAGGHSMVVSKYSKHPKEAYELSRYLTSAETQLLQAKELKTLPARVSPYQDAALSGDAIVQGFKKQLDAAKARPLIPEGSQMFSDFTPNLGQILMGKLTAEEGAKNIETAWRDMLKLDR
ncbi:extracellular solute-binding protein [Paenibacillus caseinilyticus]|uniref:ABC transporter substrate-binding protein n=1 Tax=Paenibacillus mucilaginosus K02 TaxID=997761 RepID=I0BGI8_9BACL|nr:extracellular solute-binding protein [Paenibacillus mucilaginosus]AFH61485.1 ABC transporter substrate-binding protein [Paenibacillus mucilaginosus K02]